MSQTEVSQSKIAVNLADNTEKRYFFVKQCRGESSNATVRTCNWSASVLDTIHLRRPWTRVFFGSLQGPLVLDRFSPRLKNSGHVITFL